MAQYQRFAFETLSPERQRELVEKQRKQQQQREMLLEQMEAVKRKKQAEQEAYESSMRRQDDFPRPDIPFPDSRLPEARALSTAPSTSEFIVQQPFKNPPLMLTPQRPLLADRQKFVRPERPALSMTLNPSKIHDTFSNLRSQIMATAATTVLTRSSQPSSTRAPRNATFGV